MNAPNSPSAIWHWLLLPGLIAAGLYYLWLTAAAVCAHHVARALDVQQAAEREVPQSVADEYADECLDPNLHALQGCQTCVENVAEFARVAFDESLAKLWQAEEQP